MVDEEGIDLLVLSFQLMKNIAGEVLLHENTISDACLLIQATGHCVSHHAGINLREKQVLCILPGCRRLETRKTLFEQGEQK